VGQFDSTVGQFDSTDDRKATRKARLTQYRKNAGRWQFYAVGRNHDGKPIASICFSFRAGMHRLDPELKHSQ
jgi:hypothetical protein